MLEPVTVDGQPSALPLCCFYGPLSTDAFGERISGLRHQHLGVHYSQLPLHCIDIVMGSGISMRALIKYEVAIDLCGIDIPLASPRGVPWISEVTHIS